MRLLLDTHVLLWWLDDDPALTTPARTVILDPRNALAVSAASAWEIAIKKARGRLRMPDDLEPVFEALDVQPLDISVRHAVAAGTLPPHHGDPFDRMLVAQAQVERLTLVTADPVFARYDVDVLTI